MDPETGSRGLCLVRETKILDGIVLSPKSRVPSRSSMSRKRLLLTPKSANNALNIHCKTSGVRFLSILGIKVGFLTIKM